MTEKYRAKDKRRHEVRPGDTKEAKEQQNCKLAIKSTEIKAVSPFQWLRTERC